MALPLVMQPEVSLVAAPAGPVPVVMGAVAWLGGRAGEQPGDLAGFTPAACAGSLLAVDRWT